MTGMLGNVTFNEGADIKKEAEKQLKKDSKMKYYKLSFYYNNPTEKSLDLYGEGGITWYYKTDSGVEKESILDECLKQCKGIAGYEDMLKAVPNFDYIKEISREEFYNLAENTCEFIHEMNRLFLRIKLTYFTI